MSGVADPSLELSDEDKELLVALVGSPVWGTLRRVLSSAKSTYLSQLVTAAGNDDIRKLQGIILGLDATLNIPTVLAGRHVAKNKDKKKTEDHLAKRRAQLEKQYALEPKIVQTPTA